MSFYKNARVEVLPKNPKKSLEEIYACMYNGVDIVVVVFVVVVV